MRKILISSVLALGLLTSLGGIASADKGVGSGNGGKSVSGPSAPIGGSGPTGKGAPTGGGGGTGPTTPTGGGGTVPTGKGVTPGSGGTGGSGPTGNGGSVTGKPKNGGTTLNDTADGGGISHVQYAAGEGD